MHSSQVFSIYIYSHMFLTFYSFFSWTKISHINPENTLQNSFKFCSELDLTKTLIGKWSQILNILSVFPILKILHLRYPIALFLQ